MTVVRARTSPGARIGLRFLLCGLGLAIALLTTSCGSNVFIPGTPVVTLTSKPGRFTSYIVTLVDIYLTDQNGNTFTMPGPYNQRVDLAHLDKYTNVLELYPAEQATYVSATFQIDYSTASIYVDNGGTPTVASPIDPATGTAAGSIAVTVKLDPNHPLVVNNQNSAPLALDIDLEASNIVTNSSGTLQTTVKPFWVARTVPAYNKPVFARGLYVTADTKNNNFVMNVRPLHDQVNSPFGALTVNVSDQTYYQVNGTTYVGSAGLAAIAALQNTYADLPIGAYGPVTASPFGNLNTIQPSMSATQVYVGSSLESTIEDQITGVVTSVSGDTFNITGSFADRTGTIYQFAQKIPVTVGPNTVISIDGVATSGTPPIQSISVGQYVNVTGQATTDSVGNVTGLDATGSVIGGAQVRLQNTSLWGTVGSVGSGSLVLNPLQFVENYEPSFLNFAGTGTASANDATATNYQVATGSLDLSALTAGSVVNVNGTANALASGPPYFTANAITPVSSLQQELVLEWPSGVTGAFSSVTGSQIVVSTSSAGTAVVDTGPVTMANLLTSPPPGNQVTITYNTADAQHPPLYAAGSVSLGESLFSDPTGFASNASTVVTNNATYKLVATGQYDATTGTFSATSITINAK
jgi:hypothetical protein